MRVSNRLFWGTKLVIISKERGSTYVELAILMPVLLFLIFGIIEAGLVAGVDNSLAAVVNYGIRAIAVNGGLDENIENKIYEQLELHGIDPAKVALEAPRKPVQYNDEVYLKLEYPYSFQLFGPVSENLGYNLHLVAKSYAISEYYFKSEETQSESS